MFCTSVLSLLDFNVAFNYEKPGRLDHLGFGSSGEGRVEFRSVVVLKKKRKEKKSEI